MAQHLRRRQAMAWRAIERSAVSKSCFTDCRHLQLLGYSQSAAGGTVRDFSFLRHGPWPLPAREIFITCIVDLG